MVHKTMVRLLRGVELDGSACIATNVELMSRRGTCPCMRNLCNSLTGEWVGHVANLLAPGVIFKPSRQRNRFPGEDRHGPPYGR